MRLHLWRSMENPRNFPGGKMDGGLDAQSRDKLSNCTFRSKFS
jgi:hypothetical protein